MLPGVASRTTVLANHCSTFIDSPFARTGILDGNPIHRDMIYAAQQAKLAFICNVVIDEKKEVIAAFAGHFNEAHRAGCAFVEQLSGVSAVPRPHCHLHQRRLSPGPEHLPIGEGNDRCRGHLRPRGRDHYGLRLQRRTRRQSFYDTLRSGTRRGKNHASFLATPSDRTIPDQWEAQILCRILLKHPVIMVTQAFREMVEAMPHALGPDLSAAIDLADRLLGRRTAPSR